MFDDENSYVSNMCIRILLKSIKRVNSLYRNSRIFQNFVPAVATKQVHSVDLLSRLRAIGPRDFDGAALELQRSRECTKVKRFHSVHGPIDPEPKILSMSNLLHMCFCSFLWSNKGPEHLGSKQAQVGEVQ